ncbi:ABC transporter ATP-binding protein [Trueperella bialowiezensis]|uniref:Ribose import ATP-binding protein RbsA n=1 Tax=Trueperella bialowiezensis TaxID=312285 RepID=A0A3S4V7X4_9ACTO|nr:ABC transporter ATP-binding protein [Trueperella bialowiezensis]VEI13929.1 Ribose import ATP-binding protein RbsA [Trueperella bialowiezensis]
MKLELRGITKRFGSLVANDHIDLVVEEGHIHALLGENGAGKSTLMNVLYGLYDADEGEILLDGKPVSFSGPGDAVAAGIGMVHQHFMLIPVFTVAESIALGYEPTKAGGLIDIAKAREIVRDVSARFGFDLDPDALIEDLPVGAQQRVEIVKALSRDAKVLILDEPTAVLTPQETDDLMAIMRQLADNGTSIVFITHKLREVRAVADDITVIRRGKVVGHADPSSTEAELATMMVGRPVMMKVDKEPARVRGEGLSIRNLSAFNDAGSRTLDDITFDVAQGEIVAVAGVQGNGQTELAEVIMGLQEPAAGEITLGGTDITGASVRKAIDAGIGLIPEDRSADGIIATFSVAENLILDQYRYEPFSKGPALRPKAIMDNAHEKVAEYDVRLTSVTDPVSTLSGGNQQKVVVARELSRDLQLLIANQPTRGVDVGSIEFIHKRIVDVRDSGTPVLLVSSELDEVVALADRIVVMYRGRVNGIVPADTPRGALGLMMAGVPQDEALASKEVVNG